MLSACIGCIIHFVEESFTNTVDFYTDDHCLQTLVLAGLQFAASTLFGAMFAASA